MTRRERLREIIFEAGTQAGKAFDVTLIFTAEYVARLCVVEKPARYPRSFFGIVDLVSILPNYLSQLLPGAESLLVMRSLRLLGRHVPVHRHDPHCMSEGHLFEARFCRDCGGQLAEMSK